jgi:hypothetical protein
VSAASASASATASPVAAPTTASQFIFPPTRNDLDHSILQGLLGPRNDKGDLGFGGMVAPSLLQHSALFSSGSTIDSVVVQTVGLQALVRQSVSMRATPAKRLDIDTLALLGAAKNTSLLSFSSSPQGQLLSQAHHTKRDSVLQLSSPAPISTPDILGSYVLPTDDLFQMDTSDPVALMTSPCPARGMPADHNRRVSPIFALL